MENSFEIKFLAFYKRRNSWIKVREIGIFLRNQVQKKEDFKNYYRTISNVELLKILEEKKNYQVEVGEAAEAIFSTRPGNDDDRVGQNLK